MLSRHNSIKIVLLKNISKIIMILSFIIIKLDPSYNGETKLRKQSNSREEIYTPCVFRFFFLNYEFAVSAINEYNSILFNMWFGGTRLSWQMRKIVIKWFGLFAS